MKLTIALLLIAMIGVAAAFYRSRRVNLRLPIVIFDTGAHNRLAKDPRDRGTLFAGIKAKYFFRLAGLSYEEMASTPDAAQRAAFLNDARQLKKGPWDCLNPVNEVLRLLIAAHAAAPEKFEWLKVDVRSGELNHEVTVGSLTADDELSEQQRNAQKASLQEYKTQWVTLRPKLEPAFAAEGKPRPTTFKEAVSEYIDGERKRCSLSSVCECQGEVDWQPHRCCCDHAGSRRRATPYTEPPRPVPIARLVAWELRHPACGAGSQWSLPG